MIFVYNSNFAQHILTQIPSGKFVAELTNESSRVFPPKLLLPPSTSFPPRQLPPTPLPPTPLQRRDNLLRHQPYLRQPLGNLTPFCGRDLILISRFLQSGSFGRIKSTPSVTDHSRAVGKVSVPRKAFGLRGASVAADTTTPFATQGNHKGRLSAQHKRHKV